MAIGPVSTPLRRSKRGQPIVAVSADTLDSDAPLNLPEPVFKRTTRSEDLYQEDIEALNRRDVSIEDLETHFYDRLSMRMHGVKRTLKTYGKSQRDRSSNVAAEDIYKIGDAVLVKSAARDPSVAVVVAIWNIVGPEVQQSVRVLLHWFLRPSELAGIRAARKHEENEIYYSVPSTAVVPASSLVSKCIIVTSSGDLPESDRSSPPRKSSSRKPQTTPTFLCHTSIDSRCGIYYSFSWEDLSRNALGNPGEWGSADAWNVRPADVSRKEPHIPHTPKKKRRKLSIVPEEDQNSDSEEPSSSVDGDDDYEETRHLIQSDTSDSDSSDLSELSDVSESGSDFDETSRTPSRKRKRTTSLPSTPRRKRKTKDLVAPTPHSKAALRARARRKLTVRPPPGADRVDNLWYSLENIPEDPWLRAMHVLHVASRPEALPCREEEYGKVLRAVEELVEEGSGGCVYISGVPGTGKTATVHAVVRELKRMAEQNEANPFTYVEINGLRIPEPSAAYGLLWEAVSGHNVAKEGHLKISAKESLKNLSSYFSSRDRAGPGGHACVVLMDELDQLMTNKQDVVYNFFNWPTLVGSRLVVLAVANTMDLPERVMSGRVRSRLGMTRFNFQPYTTAQLEKIVKARLTSAKEGLPADSSDVIAPDGIKFASMKVSSISGDARRVLDICRRTVELVQPFSKTARIDDVKRVIKDMQNSPIAAYIRDLSLHERIMLAAMLKCIKRAGVEEIRWGDLKQQHYAYLNLLVDSADLTRRPSPGELSLVLDSLLASRAMLCEDGPTIARKPEDDKRVVLNLEQTEVGRVLGDVGGTKWKNALSI